METVHSVIKRKFGDTIRSRSTRLQHREPIVKAMVYLTLLSSIFIFATEQLAFILFVEKAANNSRKAVETSTIDNLSGND